MHTTEPSEITSLLNDAHDSNPKRLGSENKQNEYNTIRNSDNTNHKDDDIYDTTWKIESKKLASNSIPLVLTYLGQYSYNLVMVYVAGRLGTDEQGAASLASMTANITGLCVYEGLATSLDTLTSQAYGGGKKKLVGLHMQRMSALMLIVTIPIGVVWMCSPWILVQLVPDAKIARLAGMYMRHYLVGAPGFALFEAGKRFMQAQGNFTACLAVVLICVPLNILWNWLFVFQLGLGLRGAALAVATSNLLQPLGLLLYIHLFARHTLECWPGFSFKNCFQGWGEMIKLSVPGILMVFSEWLAFDILTFMSSYISTAALAAQSVLLSVTLTMFHIASPVAIAASTRFGNLIGQGSLVAARKAWLVTFVISIGIGMFNVVLLTSLQNVIALNFTKDTAVRSIIIKTIPVVAASQFFDVMAVIGNGMLRGLGRQKIGGWVNLGVYYVWAVPLALLLTFGPPKLGLLGLWLGPFTGLAIVTIIVTIYLKCSDWQTAIEEARARGEVAC